MKEEHIYDCPQCGKEVDAMDSKNQLPKILCYKCPSCDEVTRKNDALKLMEEKDGKERWGIVNSIEKGINPLTGKSLT